MHLSLNDPDVLSYLIDQYTDDENATCLDPLEILLRAEAEASYDHSVITPTTPFKGHTMNTKAHQLPAGTIESAGVEEMQRAQSVKHYINESQRVWPTDDDIAPVITNVEDRLTALVSIAPRAEFFASNAICGSLGYTLLSQIMWNMRREASKRNTAAPTVDIFNDGYADMYEQRSRTEAMTQLGYDQLPEFKATELAGVYKRMLRLQMGNITYNQRFPVNQPHEIITALQSPDSTREVQAANTAFTEQQIAASPAAAAIRDKIADVKPKIDAAQANRNQAEAHAILSVLQTACPQPLDADMWKAIPLYVQYKWTMFVYKQIVQQIAVDSQIGAESHAVQQLLDMLNEIHLELEAAARTAEVKFAFALGRLTEKHELVRGTMPTPANVQRNVQQMMQTAA